MAKEDYSFGSTEESTDEQIQEKDENDIKLAKLKEVNRIVMTTIEVIQKRIAATDDFKIASELNELAIEILQEVK